MDKRLGNLHFNTSFRNGGRKAGMGMLYDDYSDESSGGGHVKPWEAVCFPHDNTDPEELNGPVIIVQKGRSVNNG